MIIEEKRDRVKIYCASHRCEECVLCGIWTNDAHADCLTIHIASEEELDWALNIISDENANPYWERINAIAERQRAKGMSKYGVGLESNRAAILERIEHLQEELIDGLMYCEWIKDHLKEMEG